MDRGIAGAEWMMLWSTALWRELFCNLTQSRNGAGFFGAGFGMRYFCRCVQHADHAFISAYSARSAPLSCGRGAQRSSRLLREPG